MPLDRAEQIRGLIRATRQDMLTSTEKADKYLGLAEQALPDTILAIELLAEAEAIWHNRQSIAARS